MIPLPIHFTELQRIYNATIGRDLRSLAITSAEPGEGVSTIAYALARRAAAGGDRTLLVEFNLFRPSLADSLGLVLKGPWTPDPASTYAAMTEFGSIRLSLLPAPKGISALDLLRFSDHRLMVDLFTAWRQRFDVIICDCSSINRSNKGNIGTPAICAAGIAPVLVVLAGVTTSRQVQDAVSTLAELKVSVAGTVLNKRFDPPLYQELLRETQRFRRFAPGAVAWLQTKIEKHRKFLG